MANIDAKILGRQQLKSREEEEMAGRQMQQNKMEDKRGGDIISENKGKTNNQQRVHSRRFKNKSALNMRGRMGGKGMGGSGTNQGTAILLKLAWLNLIDSFGLTLIYINLHVFGHSVMGERIFCDLGEEWIPKQLRSSLGSEKVKQKMKAISFLEKIVLILLDLTVVVALIIIVSIIIVIMDSFVVKIINVIISTPASDSLYHPGKI